MRQIIGIKLLKAIVLGSAICGVVSTSLAQDKPAVPTVVQPIAAQAELPVKSVVLFSSGVGYFEHFGSVKGDGSTELRFKTAQINDILKSLVLQDLDGGSVSTVQYPSQDPVDKTLKSFQVDITGNPPLADLLNQLRGAKVSVKLSGESYSGVVLGCEKRQQVSAPQTTPIDVWILNLIDGANIKQVELAKVSDVKLEDAVLQEELAKALQALAKARDQEKKSVNINFKGTGDRRIRLGYVVESPVWKTSYRLVMAEKESNLQGWAIVENQTDNDWNNIQLSLVSGRPISFTMDLYQPLYIPRPRVQMKLYESLRPQMYEEGVTPTGQRMEKAAKQRANGLFANGGNAPAAPVAMMADKSIDALASEPMDVTASIQSAASASKLGELFQYTIGDVSLPRQKSAMIPIVTDKVEVEKMSIYNPNVQAKHPLNGAMVTNTTGKHLLQGPITVFESGGYAGDAQIDNVPPGQKRLLSYGIDLQVIVIPKLSQENKLQTGKIVKGALELKQKLTRITEYEIENKATNDKTIVVEHQMMQAWSLVNTPDPMEKTDTLYRFKQPVPKGEKKLLKVTEEVVTNETLEILRCDLSNLVYYSQQGEIPQDVRNQLLEAIKRKQVMVDIERQIGESDAQINAITAEQSRIRENMKTVDRNTQYYTRLLEKLNTQESQIEAQQKNKTTLQEKRTAAQQELESYLTNLNIG